MVIMQRNVQSDTKLHEGVNMEVVKVKMACSGLNVCQRGVRKLFKK